MQNQKKSTWKLFLVEYALPLSIVIVAAISLTWLTLLTISLKYHRVHGNNEHTEYVTNYYHDYELFDVTAPRLESPKEIKR